ARRHAAGAFCLPFAVPGSPFLPRATDISLQRHTACDLYSIDPLTGLEGWPSVQQADGDSSPRGCPLPGDGLELAADRTRQAIVQVPPCPVRTSLPTTNPGLGPRGGSGGPCGSSRSSWRFWWAVCSGLTPALPARRSSPRSRQMAYRT